MFIVELFTVAERLKNIKSSSTNEWINKIYYMYIFQT